MSRTKRRTWLGEVIRDGQWGRRCGAENCDRCVTGDFKRPARRAARRSRKHGTRDTATSELT